MKIIHLIGGGDVGGAKTHIYTLLTGLAASGIDITLVSFREGEFADEAIALGIKTIIISNKNPLADFGELRKIYLDGGYDIVHCHGAKGNMMGWYLKRTEEATTVTTVHSDPKLDYMGRPLALMTYGVINKFALRRMDYHIGVSDMYADMLIERGFSPHGIFTIYNGLDFNEKPDSFDRAEFLAEYGIELDEGDVLCGIAARLNPVKDMPTLLRAFEKAPDNLKLIVAGDGEQMEYLRTMTTELGIEKRVFFVGWLDGTLELFEALDVNLLTSLSESNPYSVTEGARGRCATICSAVGGLKLMIDHGVNGFLFEPGNVDELAKYLTRLAKDSELREKFAARFYNKMKSLLSIEATVEKQLEIYRTIIRRKTRKAGRRDCVTICGAYGRGNAGDDAILEAVVREMREIDPDRRICVMSRTPKKTSISYRTDSIFTFNLLSMGRAFKRSGLYINGGGSLMQDVTSTRSILFYLYTIRAAKLLGCKVMMYGCGIGPITREKNRRRAARTINRCVDAVTLREDSSLDELKSLGVDRPEVTLSADPVLGMPPADPALVEAALIKYGLEDDREYIGFSLRKWAGFEQKAGILRQAAEYAYEQHGLVPVFIPIEQEQDVGAAKLVADGMKCPCVIIEQVDRAGIAIGLITHMKVMVSMRLHGLIFAAGQGVPLVGISYDPKVTAFMKYMGIDLCAGLESLELDSLKEMLDLAVQTDRAEMAQSVERLRELERRNIAVAAGLMKGMEI